MSNELMAQLDLDQRVAVQSLLAAAKFAVKSEEDRATVWTATHGPQTVW